MLGGLFEHKKSALTFLVALCVTAIVIVTVCVRPDLAETAMVAALAALTGLGGTFNIGQGIADRGNKSPP